MRRFRDVRTRVDLNRTELVYQNLPVNFNAFESPDADPTVPMVLRG